MVVSQDLDELLHISDRIAVLSAGRMSETMVTAEADIGRIGMLMGGQGNIDGGGQRAAQA